MQSVEITAKSVEEAQRLAADKLGVSPDRVNVTVLEQTKGLFGKSNLRVRAEAVDAVPAAPAAEETSKPAAAAGGTPRGRGRSKAAVAEPAPAEVAAPETPQEAIQEGFDETPAEGGRGRGRRRGGKKEDATAPAPAEAAEGGEEGTEETVVATDADAEGMAAILRELLDSAGLSVDVKPAGLNGRYINLQLDGKDVAFLVGKHGEVLNALQYLLNIIAGRRLASNVRATLDGNDYRRRREEQLTQLATNIADQVKQRGEEAVLDALPAFERRIVHKALSTIPGVTTYSEGEEPNRRVVIAPGG